MSCRSSVIQSKSFALIRLINEEGEALTTYNSSKLGVNGRHQKVKEIYGCAESLENGKYKIEAKTSLASKSVVFPFTIGEQELAAGTYPAPTNLDNKEILRLSIELATLKQEMSALESEYDYLKEVNDQLIVESGEFQALAEIDPEPSVFDVFLAQAAPYALDFLKSVSVKKVKNDREPLSRVPVDAVNYAIKYSDEIRSLVPENIFNLSKKISAGINLTGEETELIFNKQTECLRVPNEESSQTIFHALGGYPMYEYLKK